MIDIDDLAARSGATLRDTVATVDVESSLADLRVRRRRHQTQLATRLVAAAAAVAVVAVVMVTRDPGANVPQPAPPGPSPTRGFTCDEGPSVHCLSGGRVRVEAARPFTLVPPAGFASDVSVGQGVTELFRDDTDANSGVAFYDAATPARRSRHLDAEQFAGWVAARPDLNADPPRRTTVAGRPAWQVQVTAPTAPRDPALTCNEAGSPCWPVIGRPRGPGLPPWETGPWKDMANRYTFIDLPGRRTFVIWSWAYAGNWAAIEANDDLIRTLRLQRS